MNSTTMTDDEIRQCFVDGQVTLQVCEVSLVGSESENVGFSRVKFDDLYGMVSRRKRIHVPYFGTLRGKVKAQQELNRWKKLFAK